MSTFIENRYIQMFNPRLDEEAFLEGFVEFVTNQYFQDDVD